MDGYNWHSYWSQYPHSYPTVERSSPTYTSRWSVLNIGETIGRSTTEDDIGITAWKWGRNLLPWTGKHSAFMSTMRGWLLKLLWTACVAGERKTVVDNGSEMKFQLGIFFKLWWHQLECRTLSHGGYRSSVTWYRRAKFCQKQNFLFKDSWSSIKRKIHYRAWTTSQLIAQSSKHHQFECHLPR